MVDVEQEILGTLTLEDGIKNPSGLTATVNVIVDPPVYNIMPKIAAGPYHIVGLSSSGNIYVTGDDNYYEDDDYNPTDISGWEDEIVVDIWAKGENTVALTEDGRLLACGEIASYGINASLIAGWSNNTDVYVGYTVIAARLESGQMVAVSLGDADSLRIRNYVLGWGAADDITIGKYHAVAIKDGQYWSTTSSTLGDERTAISNLRDIEVLYSDERFTACLGSAVDFDGNVVAENVLFAVGRYSNDKLLNINMDFPIDNTLNRPDLVGVKTVSAWENLLITIKEDGTVALVNLNTATLHTKISAAENWTDIIDAAAGMGNNSNFIVGLHADGTVEYEYARGNNNLYPKAWNLITG